MKNKETITKEKINEIWESIKPYLTKEAIERLSNLKVAHTEKWLNAIIILYQYIIKSLQNGKNIKIDENLLKNLLSKLFEENKRKTKIRFVR